MNNAEIDLMHKRFSVATKAGLDFRAVRNLIAQIIRERREPDLSELDFIQREMRRLRKTAY